MQDDDNELRRERWEAAQERKEEREEEIKVQMDRIRIRREAEMRVDAPPFPALPIETAAEALARPQVVPDSRVHELLYAEHNGLLIAERKTGKTTLALDFAVTLANGEHFLNYQTKPLIGRVGFFNYEMAEWQFNEWLRRLDAKHPERIVPFHFKGQGTPLMYDHFREVLADRLRELEIEVLILDPIAKAWRGAVDNENNNSEVGAFTAALDDLKRQAGISEMLVTHHKGRAEQAEGQERGRGAIALEDWADALWVLTRDATGCRSLRAEGRDVDVEAFDLDFDQETGRFSAGGLRKRRKTEAPALKAVMAALEAGPDGAHAGDIDQVLERDGMSNRTDRSNARKAAKDLGWFEPPKKDPEHGSYHVWKLTSKGRKAAEAALERAKS